MSGIVDVGDAIEVTFATVPGATVTVSWLDPYDVASIDSVVVAENPAASGKYPKTFIATSPGMWKARFTASGTTAAVEDYFVHANPLTGPAPLASVGDVVAQFGPMTAAQDGLTAYLVRAASALLRQRVRQLGRWIDADIAAGWLDSEVATLTVANMVLRVLRNPNGLRSETIGPFSKTFDVQIAAGLLVVTDYDLGAVTPEDPPLPDGLCGLQIGTIRIVPGMAPPVGWPYRGAATRPAPGWYPGGPPYGRY